MDLHVLKLPNSLEYLGEQSFLISGSGHNIEYSGTAEEFVNLAKNSNWNRFSFNYNIICKDRTLRRGLNILKQDGRVL